MAYLYRHIRLDKNEPFYIGIGSDDSFKRANWKWTRNNLWNKIINKTDYRVDIILSDITLDYAKQKEKEFINLYGRKNLNTGILCNLTDGGEGVVGLKITEETRKKLSDSHKGLKGNRLGHKNSQETREKLSKALKGRTSPNKGKKISEHQKMLISMAQKGRIHTKEEIKKRSDSNRGKTRNRINVIDTWTGIIYTSNMDAMKSCKKHRGNFYQYNKKTKRFIKWS